MNLISSKSVSFKKRGVVLLIAILISSVALAVGVGVYTRTYKELLLSSFWKQSQIAFAAADGGLECTLYHETHSTGGQLDCLGSVISASDWKPGNNGKFKINANPGCADVNVTKWAYGTGPGSVGGVGGITTRIESRGQSESCISSNPRRVERAIRLEY